MIASPRIIREATPLDRTQILKINRQAWEQCYTHIFSPQEITGLFRNILRQHGSWIYQRDERLNTLVTEIEGQVVGFIGMSSLLNHRTAEITSFYLQPDYHGQGIGKHLWQTAINYLRESGYYGIWVWVLEKAHARTFYEAQGCRPRKMGTYSVGTHHENAIGYWLDL